MLALTAEPNHKPPRVRVDISTTPNRTLPVGRVIESGDTRSVRQADPITVNASGAATVYDYEIPYGERLSYLEDGSRETRSTVAVPSKYGWLISPGDPETSIPMLFIANREPIGYESGTTHAKVIGRKHLVPSTNVQRFAGTEGFTLRTFTQAEEMAYQRFFDTNDVVLISIPGYASVRPTYEYVTIEGLSMGWPDNGRTPKRSWTFTTTPVDRPEGGLNPPWNFGRLKERGLTYAQVRQQYRNFRALRLDERS